jgi:hypothetical protein
MPVMVATGLGDRVELRGVDPQLIPCRTRAIVQKEECLAILDTRADHLAEHTHEKANVVRAPGADPGLTWSVGPTDRLTLHAERLKHDR